MKAPIVAVLMSLASSTPVLADTFVYVSNAEDGDIGMYTLQADGSLQPGQRFKATRLVMPMAVSPDKRFIFAAVRSKPFQAYSYSIDKSSGALNLVGTGTLAESYPYIALDRSGRFLLGASYGANQVGVNPVGADGRIGEPLQVLPTARNAHSIRTDNTNRFAFVPHLGTDQVFQFLFDEKSGRLTANTPPVLQLKQGTGPRYLVPGAPRGAVGTPGANQPPRNTDNDIWASDLHPIGRYPTGKGANWVEIVAFD
jgi:6-phosphogluconolactonase